MGKGITKRGKVRVKRRGKVRVKVLRSIAWKGKGKGIT